MAVYGSQYIEGKIQEVRYSAATASLFWVPRLGGVDVKPTSVVALAYNAAGTKVTSTSVAFASCDAETEVWVGLSTISARFNIGAELSCSTTGFTGTIRDVQYSSATSGRAYIVDAYKTLVSGSVVTDDGTTPGAGKVVGVPYSPVMYATIDASGASSYPIGENYRLEIRLVHGGRTYYDQLFFDVVYQPIDVMTTSKMIDDRHPDWASMRGREWRSWGPAIHAGHAELCRRIRAQGRRPALIAKREELAPYEFAFIEAEIARRALSFEDRVRAHWVDAAEDAWVSKGEFAYRGEDSSGTLETYPVVFGGEMTR